MSILISRTARSVPKLPYSEMKEAVLGESYQLSLNFVGEKRAKALNQKYRKASYVPNVLSFPLEKNFGEVYITPNIAKREAKKFGLSPQNYIGYLFIHGLLHLKGHVHNDTMSKAEKRYMKRFELR